MPAFLAESIWLAPVLAHPLVQKKGLSQAGRQAAPAATKCPADAFKANDLRCYACNFDQYVTNSSIISNIAV